MHEADEDNGWVLVTLFCAITMLYRITLEGTAFTTCVLSLTRTIGLYNPFYRPSKKGITIAHIVFFVYILIRESVRAKFYYEYRMGATKEGTLATVLTASNYFKTIFLGLVVAVVAVSTVMTVMALLCSKDQVQSADGNTTAADANKRATVTVVMICVLFCILNTFLVVVFGLGLANIDTSTIIDTYSKWIGVPINSAINPMIYFARKNTMRNYAVELWLRYVCRRKVAEGRNTHSTRSSAYHQATILTSEARHDEEERKDEVKGTGNEGAGNEAVEGTVKDAVNGTGKDIVKDTGKNTFEETDTI